MRIDYIKANLKTCQQRDVKGLYKKALQGIVKDFTGISAPYEEPLDPEIVIDTELLSIKQSVKKILKYLQERNEKND